MPMESTDPPMFPCPNCRHENPRGSIHCAFCAHPLTEKPAELDENPWSPPAAADSSSRTFTIGSLMLVIAVIAVCLGVTVAVPGLGVLLILAIVPASIRTLLAISSRRAAGKPLTVWEKFVVFAGSLAVVAAIGIGSFIAFVVTCFPVGFVSVSAAESMVGLVLAFVLGIVAAGFTGFYLVRNLWPRRNP
jgi:hypothetical protein